MVAWYVLRNVAGICFLKFDHSFKMPNGAKTQMAHFYNCRNVHIKLEPHLLENIFKQSNIGLFGQQTVT